MNHGCALAMVLIAVIVGTVSLGMVVNEFDHSRGVDRIAQREYARAAVIDAQAERAQAFGQATQMFAMAAMPYFVFGVGGLVVLAIIYFISMLAVTRTKQPTSQIILLSSPGQRRLDMYRQLEMIDASEVRLLDEYRS